jgi:hypothetical protein
LLKAVVSFYLLTKGVAHVIQNLGCGRLARLRQIDEMAARKGIDRSALLRSFFLCALKEYTIRDSLEDYKAGIATLWEAAQRCNLSLWEMIQEVRRAHIHTSYDLKEFKKDLSALNG